MKDPLRPFKGYSTIRVTNNDGNATYNGLQVLNLNKRYSNGLLYTLAYTYSKSMDDGSAQRDVIPNPFDRSMLWGPSNYDRRHVFVGDLHTASCRSFADARALWARCWAVGKSACSLSCRRDRRLRWAQQMTSRASDLAMVPGLATRATTMLLTTACLLRSTTLLAIRIFPEIRNSLQSAEPPDPNLYFNPAAFVRPAPGTFTTQRNRNLLYNPGFQNWTGSVVQKIRNHGKPVYPFPGGDL